MPVRKWTTEENLYLMEAGYKVPWSQIAEVIGKSEGACQAQYSKIRKLRIASGTWRGIK